MTMRELGGYAGVTDTEQLDSLLEDEIQQALSRLGDDIDPDVTDSHSDTEADETQENVDNDTEDDLMPSMSSYISWIQNQTKHMEEELQECDDILQQSDLVSSRKLPSQDDEMLKELAQKEGLDIQVLKNKILQEICQEDEEDQRRMQEISLEPGPDDSKHEMTTDSPASEQPILVDTKDDSIVRTTAAQSEKTQSLANVEPFMIPIGQGIVAEITEADLLEKELWRNLKLVDEKKKEKEEIRKKEAGNRVAEENQRQTELDEKRRLKQDEYKQEEILLKQQQHESDVRLQREVTELRKQIESSLKVYETEIQQLSEKTTVEKQELEEMMKLERDRQRHRRQKAAITIQSAYRGHRVRKVHKEEINKRMQDLRKHKEMDRVKEIEKEKELASEEKKKQEQKELERIETEKKKQEEQKLKAEEEMKKKREEEKRKIEEEIMRKEEERLRKEEDKRQKEEEKKAKEEEKRKKEQEKKLKEEERKRKIEDEKKKKAEEKRQKEEEQKNLEEERKKKEEAEAKLKEEKEQKLLEEMRQKQAKEAEQKEPPNKQTTGESTPQSVTENTASVSSSVSPVSQISPTASPPTPPLIPKPPQTSSSRPLTSSKSRQGIVSVRSSRAFLVGLHPPPSWGDNLPGDINQKRLDWIRDCTAWSKVLGELKTRRAGASKKPPRRPVSGQKLPLLVSSVILEAARVSSIQQVTTVELKDLPGCSIKTLSQCPQLRSLAMPNCHLVTTEGIEYCKKLEYVDFQENVLESINFKDLNQLTHLDLSHNTLSSIHGLDGCSKLKSLNLSHNKITRIAGLEHLQSLHTLVLSNNQLITCRGVGVAATVQVLNVAHNHLPTIEDLDKLGLLQTLDVCGNNLLKVPKLCNHVLLHTLLLGDNSITSLQALTESWVPMLQTLSVKQNSLTSFPDIVHCLLVENLDISHNQILDMQSILPGLNTLRHLGCLTTDGNPVSEEKDWRSVVEEKLPYLQTLDGIALSSRENRLPFTKYESMCLGQVQQHQALEQAYRVALGKVRVLDDKCAVHDHYHAQSYTLATEHRYTHEYGEISPHMSTAINTEFLLSNLTITDNVSTTSVNNDTKRSSKGLFDAALTTGGSTGSVPVNPRLKVQSNTDTPTDWKGQVDASLESRTPRGSAAGSRTAQIQSAAENIRRESQSDVSDNKAKFDALFSAQPTRNNSASLGRQASDPGVSGNRSQGNASAKPGVAANTVGKILKDEGMLRVIGHVAAIKIQSLWRGYSLRRRLTYAMMYARLENDDDGNVDDFGEVDLDDFNFDEDDLEKDWKPSSMPQLPENHAVLRHPEGKENQSTAGNKPPAPPGHPRDAWRMTFSPGNGQASMGSGKPPLPPLSRLSNHTPDTLTEGARTQRSRLSRREEKISEDWGFTDQHTAEHMYQRAKRLKLNADKKKKISKLDPKQRLALFRKLEQSSRTKAALQVAPKGVPRQEYFQAREAEVKRVERERVQEVRSKEARTYEWLHTQVGNHEVTSSKIHNREMDKQLQSRSEPVQQPAFYNSEGNLPRMDASVLAGKRALLTGSPVSMDLQSVESASMMGDVPRPRVMSRADSAGERLPPIKSSSAPSARPEKLSWRNKDVNQSVGWGGGKKRHKVKY